MSINYYNDNAEKFFENTVSVDMSCIYKEFISLLPVGARILDMGCGSGRDSLYFIEFGFDVIAIDASQKMVAMASDLIKRPVLHLMFQEINFENEFDGIWACASLLHVPRVEMKSVMDKISNSLKDEGLLYCSFKYGAGEEERDGRFFNSYDESEFSNLVKLNKEFIIIKLWRTVDVRSGRADEYWLNCILRKVVKPIL